MGTCKGVHVSQGRGQGAWLETHPVYVVYYHCIARNFHGMYNYFIDQDFRRQPRITDQDFRKQPTSF